MSSCIVAVEFCFMKSDCMSYLLTSSNQNFYMGILGIQELIFILIAILLPLIALINIFKSDFKERITKTLWILVIILIPAIGPILYFLITRNKRKEPS